MSKSSEWSRRARGLIEEMVRHLDAEEDISLGIWQTRAKQLLKTKSPPGDSLIADTISAAYVEGFRRGLTASAARSPSRRRTPRRSR